MKVCFTGLGFFLRDGLNIRKAEKVKYLFLVPLCSMGKANNSSKIQHLSFAETSLCLKVSFSASKIGYNIL